MFWKSVISNLIASHQQNRYRKKSIKVFEKQWINIYKKKRGESPSVNIRDDHVDDDD